MNTKQKTWYINSKNTDVAFIILCPLIAFALVCLICEPRMKNGAFLYGKETPYWFAILATLLTHSHVLLVFLRSHMNVEVFKKFPYRFTVIPIFLLLGMWVSPLFFGALGILALYWDEWHSLMQTFGFGRIYDSRLGSNPDIGRKLDIGLCFVIGLLPHLVLFTYIPDSMRNEGLIKYFEMSEAGANQFGHIVSFLRIPLISFGLGYFVFYLYKYRQFINNGYHYSRAKQALFATTGVTTILTASFFTVADSVFFGNIYHALQYYFIVLISERPNLSRLTGLPAQNKRGLNSIYFLVIVPFVLVFALLRQHTSNFEYLAGFWLLTSLMHFWFDGFIWSVRSKDI